MATNLNIDPGLLNEALKVGGQKTKKETVNQALREFIERRKQEEIVSQFGSIIYETGYDYKKYRERNWAYL